MRREAEIPPNTGWHYVRNKDSLPEAFLSVNIPVNAGFWRTLFTFLEPGLMVAVGYMDSGNWATDIAGGA